MNNRVAKKFFNKLKFPIAITVYIFAVLNLAGLFTNPLTGIVFTGIMVIGPMIGYMLYETWRDSVREVEHEDLITMNALKEK